MLREYQLDTGISKCYFYQRHIHYLGHITLEEGITIDLEKIEAIRRLPTPKNIIEVSSVIGISIYYMKFIEGFCKISHPIYTTLQNKEIKFEWT
jgi:hypothetical protein